RFFPRQLNRYKDLSDEEKVTNIMYLWKEQIRYYTKNYKALLSISGGNDSRVSLALASDFKTDINFFTYSSVTDENKSDNIELETLYKDKVIVDKLLQLVDINHQFILFGDESNTRLDSSKEEIINKNSTFNDQDMLLEYYENYYPETNVIHIRSNLLEIARAHNITPRKTNNYREILNTMRYRLRNNWKETLSEEMKTYELKKVEEYNYTEYLYGYHLLDLFHWEHRVGRWHTEVLNGTDYSYETMLPFNLRAIIETSLAFELTKRKNDYLFKEIINKSLPILNFLGVNKLENIYETDIAPKLRSSVVSEFKVCDEESLELVYEAINNQIYIPEKNLKVGAKAYVDFVFILEKGTMSLDIHNKFKSDAAANYIRYEVLVNDKIVLYEDISKSATPNVTHINNLRKSDVVRVQVVSLRDIPLRS